MPTSVSENGQRPLLELDGLTVGYGKSEVVHGVSLEVREGETVALVGRNGAGKSTILKAISGLLVPRSGEIRFDGQALSRRPHRIAAQRIAHVREGRKIFPQQSVRDNLLMGAYVRKDRATIHEDVARVVETFPVLRDKAAQLAGSLSGGEQQMLAIGMGLMLRPRLLLLDEPSHGLAPIIVQDIFDQIEELQRQGVTILLVEQMVQKALQLSHRAYVLDAGRVVLDGTGDELLSNERVKHTYLGTLNTADKDK